MKYRKKPVIVDAIRWTGTEESLHECLLFIADGKPNFDHLPITDGYIHAAVGYGNGEINIPTLEGNMRAKIGDYIIKGVIGEFYPCDAKVFEATYEAIAEEYGYPDDMAEEQ